MTRASEAEATVVAYFRDTAWQDRPGDAGDPEHRDELVGRIAIAAVGPPGARDDELFAWLVGEACRRGRGAALLKVIEQHRAEAESAEQQHAEVDGELTPIAAARWRRGDPDGEPDLG